MHEIGGKIHKAKSPFNDTGGGYAEKSGIGGDTSGISVAIPAALKQIGRPRLEEAVSLWQKPGWY